MSFTGSLVAFAKLQGLTKRGALLPKAMQKPIMTWGPWSSRSSHSSWCSSHPYGPVVFLFFVLALGFGVIMTMPIGGADMPVVISLYNALTGLAVGLEGFVLDNAAMIIAGTVVGSAGTLFDAVDGEGHEPLACQRPVRGSRYLGCSDRATIDRGQHEGHRGSDAAIMMAFAERVIIIPGYGMAVAQAQHKIWELTELLEERGVMVKFAIHPVAGRMPGHMNVLLAEAGVPYDKIYDLEDVNAEFPKTDVALIIGANDVVNPDARTNKSSPIYGMPILDADKAKNVIVIKRGKGTGFSGVENTLFYADNTRLLYGDGQKMASELIQGVKGL